MTTTLAPPRTAPPAVAMFGLFLVSLLIGLVFTGSMYSSPFIDDGEIARYYADNAGALRWIALTQFLSALALLVFTAVISERVPGARIAAAGGYLSAGLLAVNALTQWVLTYDGVIASPEARRGFHLLFFGLGGFGHVAAGGVMVAGLCLTGVLPKVLRQIGWVLAALSVLSLFTFVTEAATLLIPIGRFPTLLWLVAVGYALR
ncbi:hypothetical protein [Actinophytocola sp. NPDC049390]|uniref:hypothetical protein n=1 Tax=Actinophytocola sp. NPDC049390 TaxID=3363894 RepID=UPI0037BA358C